MKFLMNPIKLNFGNFAIALRRQFFKEKSESDNFVVFFFFFLK